MEKFIAFLIDVVDKNYHQKKIFKFLDNLNIKIIFDIGAHKGEFLKSIKQLKKFNKIYAFEPQKKIYNKLQLLNEDNKIICLNLAISDNSGIKNLKINKKSSTSTFSEIDTSSKWYKMKSLLLAGNIKTSFLAQEEVNTSTLLKIDTEGHEKEVLQGASSLLLNKKIKYILIEFHLSKMYQNYSTGYLEELLAKSNFLLLKKFKFPFLSFEDRIYKLL